MGIRERGDWGAEKREHMRKEAAMSTTVLPVGRLFTEAERATPMNPLEAPMIAETMVMVEILKLHNLAVMGGIVMRAIMRMIPMESIPAMVVSRRRKMRIWSIFWVLSPLS